MDPEFVFLANASTVKPSRVSHVHSLKKKEKNNPVVRWNITIYGTCIHHFWHIWLLHILWATLMSRSWTQGSRAVASPQWLTWQSTATNAPMFLLAGLHVPITAGMCSVLAVTSPLLLRYQCVCVTLTRFSKWNHCVDMKGGEGRKQVVGSGLFVNDSTNCSIITAWRKWVNEHKNWTSYRNWQKCWLPFFCLI